jgi:hypothetical protein
MTTEIYSCKDGQPLKEGKLDYSSDITNREQAEADAKRRCQKDPTIKKVAYYKVASNGDFRVFSSYTNPNCKPAGAKPEAAKPVRKALPKKPPKLSLWGKIAKALGLG